jgi:hypothetical protein
MRRLARGRREWVFGLGVERGDGQVFKTLQYFLGDYQ